MRYFVMLIASSSIVLGSLGVLFGIMTFTHAIILLVAGTILAGLEVGGLKLTCIVIDLIVSLISIVLVLLYKLFVHDRKTPQEVK